MNEADGRIAALAEQQFGVFSRKQAAAEGLSEEAMSRRVMTKRWAEMFPAVYRLPGATRTGRQRAMAAVLWGGSESAISHTTAARLLRLDAVRTDELHLTLPSNFGRRSRGFVVHRMAAKDVPRWFEEGSVLNFTGERIETPPSSFKTLREHAFEQARRMGLTSPATLARRFEELGGKGRPGSSRVRRLVGVQTPEMRPLESRLEVKLARLLRASSLPKPERQHRVGRYRLDFAWPNRVEARPGAPRRDRGGGLADRARDLGRRDAPARSDDAARRVGLTPGRGLGAHAESPNFSRLTSNFGGKRAMNEAVRRGCSRSRGGRGRDRASCWCRTTPAARGRRNARARRHRSCRACPAARTRRPSRR